MDDDHVDVVEEIFTQIKNTQRRAGSLESIAVLLGTLGVIGGLVIAVIGITSDNSGGGVFIALGLFNILIWLFVSVLGLGFASRMKLAAAEARMRASQRGD